MLMCRQVEQETAGDELGLIWSIEHRWAPAGELVLPIQKAL
jgi:hypothetical protein